MLRSINRILRKNRKILHLHLGEENMIKIPKVRLMQEGLSFDYHTHILKTTKGHSFVFCYEFGIHEIEADFVLIVRNNLALTELLE